MAYKKVIDMDTGRISELLEPFLGQPLPQSQLEQVSTYVDLLLRWNARINLTAIRKEDEIITRHFGESFFMARHLFPSGLSRSSIRDQSLRVIDIGSGAGFPAIPLKLWAPQIDLTLIESNQKKAAFLREVARTLELTSIQVLTKRAESLAANQGFLRAEVVTMRAVEHFETVLADAVKLLRESGRLALLIGSAQLPLDGLVHWTSVPIPNSAARMLAIGVRA